MLRTREDAYLGYWQCTASGFAQVNEGADAVCCNKGCQRKRALFGVALGRTLRIPGAAPTPPEAAATSTSGGVRKRADLSLTVEAADENFLFGLLMGNEDELDPQELEQLNGVLASPAKLAQGRSGFAAERE